MSTQMHLFNLRAQGTIEMQALKLLRLYKNYSMRMTDSNNSGLRCLNHNLHINVKLLHAHSADHNSFIIISSPCSLDAFDLCL